MVEFTAPAIKHLNDVVEDEEIIRVAVVGGGCSGFTYILDFSPSRECASCHPQQYQEWKLSSHYKSTNNPIFKIQKNKAKEHFNNKGDRFCIQCHSPSLLISGLYDTDTLELSDDINEIINDGIGCDFCHSTTRLNTA